jgi:hypothetical protein
VPVDPIPSLCTCTPPSQAVTTSDGSRVRTCTICGASMILLSDNLPAFIRDDTVYEVSIELSAALLKSFLGLLKTKSGRTTPELLELARRGGTLALFKERASAIHYELRELVSAGCPVRVEPPYPHDLAAD